MGEGRGEGDLYHLQELADRQEQARTMGVEELYRDRPQDMQHYFIDYISAGLASAVE